MPARAIHLGLLLLLFHFLSSASLFAARAKPDRTDIFFTNYTIPRIRIQLDTNALAALRNKYREYVKGTVIEGETTYRDVGIHLKGQYATFQGIDGRPSLTLNFDKFVKGQNFRGLDKFHLNNSAQDPSYLCEIIGRELFQAAGVPTARATHARVELNGRDLGLFVFIEGTDKSFLKRHFKNPNGNLYDSGFRHDISEGIEKKSGQGPDDHSDLHTLLAAAGEANHEVRIEKLSSLLDMERFYNMLALELMIRHFDGYAISVNNYRLYQDPVNQKTVFLPHGMDQLFQNPQAALLPDLRGTLAMAVLQTQAGRREFRSRCALFYTNHFSNLKNRVETAQARIRPLFVGLGADAVSKQNQGFTNLLRRIRERVQHLEHELSDAFVARPDFQVTNEVILTNWLVNSDSGKAVLSRTNVNGQQVMEIKAAKPGEAFSARLQTRVSLPKGLYLLSILVTANEPAFRGPNCPVSLEVWGTHDTHLETVRKDSQTVELRCSVEIFSLTPHEILLECRARGATGHVSYNFSRIALQRLN